MAGLSVPALLARIRDALEGVVVLLGDLVHVEPLGSLPDIPPLVVVVERQLHPKAVVGPGVAQETGPLVLDSVHDSADIWGDHGRAEQLGLHVQATEASR